ncbi:MAG: tRNA pseudouridine(38-40) synthase TruA [Fibrobacterales bacterium]
MKYRFKVEYDGTDFHGWQIQDNASTVQEELEKAFEIALRKPIKVSGSGRTDAGVHSSGQVACFDWDAYIDTYAITRSINALTPETIAIRELELCQSDFSPRYDAEYRYYIYTVYTRTRAIQRRYGWDCTSFKLNLDYIRSEMKYFLGTHDFINFCIPRDDGKPTDCILSLFTLKEFDGGFELHIQGNRFLHKMVRSMVGILIDVGRGHHPPGSVLAIFKNEFSGERMWAKPNGLNLTTVQYKDY